MVKSSRLVLNCFILHRINLNTITRNNMAKECKENQPKLTHSKHGKPLTILEDLKNHPYVIKLFVLTSRVNENIINKYNQ